MKKDNVKDKMVFLDTTFTKRVLFNEEKILNFILNLMPGQEIPPHQHEESDLVIHVLTGTGLLKVDDSSQNISPGDVIYCTGEEVFSLKNNGSENMSSFVVIAPRPGVKAYSAEIGK